MVTTNISISSSRVFELLVAFINITPSYLCHQLNHENAHMRTAAREPGSLEVINGAVVGDSQKVNTSMPLDELLETVSGCS